MTRVTALFAAVLVAACSQLAGPSATPTATTSATLGPPEVSCHASMTGQPCRLAAEAALTAVAGSGRDATHAWVTDGLLAPYEEGLFGHDPNFPYPLPPAGGHWVGSVEIAFAGTAEHAGVHVAQVGAGLVPILIGYNIPLPDWCSGDCPTSSVSDGAFTLELVLPRLAWSANEPILGTAILIFDGREITTIYGSGAGVVAFSFDEVGGPRHVRYGMSDDCRPHELDPATPINAELFKSGGVTGTEPDADFLRSFFADPELQLPAGTWDVTAVAVFFAETVGCVGQMHTLEATARISVSD